MLEKLNKKSTIIIIGRSHSGTRILPEVLQSSGIFMGAPLNVASDLLPPDELYEACKIFGQQVIYKGNYHWDFTNAVRADIPIRFKQLLESYLQSLIQSNRQPLGWKIPENTLIYPWLCRLLPKATFIYWVRHPEGSCGRMAGVDRLEKWGIPCKKFWFHEWNYKIRVVSWKYHYDIVMHTPRPQNFLRIRFEDYVQQQDRSRKAVEELIGYELKNIELDQAKVVTYQRQLSKKYPFLRESMNELGYQELRELNALKKEFMVRFVLFPIFSKKNQKVYRVNKMAGVLIIIGEVSPLRYFHSCRRLCFYHSF